MVGGVQVGNNGDFEQMDVGEASFGHKVAADTKGVCKDVSIVHDDHRVGAAAKNVDKVS